MEFPGLRRPSQSDLITRSATLTIIDLCLEDHMLVDAFNDDDDELSERFQGELLVTLLLLMQHQNLWLDAGSAIHCNGVFE